MEQFLGGKAIPFILISSEEVTQEKLREFGLSEKCEQQVYIRMRSGQSKEEIERELNAARVLFTLGETFDIVLQLHLHADSELPILPKFVLLSGGVMIGALGEVRLDGEETIRMVSNPLRMTRRELGSLQIGILSD